jgi:hypothetical protein
MAGPGMIAIGAPAPSSEQTCTPLCISRGRILRYPFAGGTAEEGLLRQAFRLPLGSLEWEHLR